MVASQWGSTLRSIFTRRQVIVVYPVRRLMELALSLASFSWCSPFHISQNAVSKRMPVHESAAADSRNYTRLWTSPLG